MSSGGWVKLHRQLLKNPIFKNDKIFRVFIYLLLSAQHTEGEMLIGDTIVPLGIGQCVTGRQAISRDTGLTEQNVRTALSKLEKLGILTIKPTTKFSIISITNWSKYQQDNQQPTNSQPTANQQLTTNKKVKNEENDKNEKEISNLPTDGKPPASKKFNADDVRFAEWFYQGLLTINHNHKKPNFESSGWADAVRLMRERDGRTYDQMADLFRWVLSDGFWSSNILSPKKLREKWDQLAIKMKQPQPQQRPTKHGVDDNNWVDGLINGELL